MTECYRILETEEFKEWLLSESPRSRYQIESRLKNIRLDGHFGTKNNVSKKDKGELKDRVWELKFNDGRRIYYSYFAEQNILLLLGGNKNGQTKDITKAKSIFLKSFEVEVKGKSYEKKTTKDRSRSP